MPKESNWIRNAWRGEDGDEALSKKQKTKQNDTQKEHKETYRTI
jgi:hypothetical protein